MGVNEHCKSDLSFRWVSGGLRSTRWPPLLFFNPSPNDRPGPGVYFMYDPMMDFAGGDVSFIFHPLMEYLNCILGGCLGMVVSYEDFLCSWGEGGGTINRTEMCLRSGLSNWRILRGSQKWTIFATESVACVNQWGW